MLPPWLTFPRRFPHKRADRTPVNGLAFQRLCGLSTASRRTGLMTLNSGGVSRVAKGADCKSAAVWLRRFESFLPHQPSLAKREKAASPKPNGRRRAVSRELRLGKPRSLARPASLQPTRFPTIPAPWNKLPKSALKPGRDMCVIGGRFGRKTASRSRDRG